MFELLLQADRALSGGNLDQAERTYWQLSELEPTNAIAIAGLARVALERGDLRLARIFAVRAQIMDPENVAAYRIIETIDEGAVDVAQGPEALPEDLSLGTAQLLEALSRKRLPSDEDAGEATSPESPQEAGADGEALVSAVADSSAAVASEPESEPLPQLPVEPADRRRFGRELAAAAAEMEAGAAWDSAYRRRPSGRPEFHLTPVPERGRRRFEPEEMKAPALANDPFAAAESEAVIEAVDAVDEGGEVGAIEAPQPEAFDSQGAGAIQDVETDAISGAAREAESDEIPEAEAQAIADARSEEATEAIAAAGSEVAAEFAQLSEPDETDAEDSFALRLAVLGYEGGPEIEDATPASSDEPDDLLDLRMSLLAAEADLRVDEHQEASMSPSEPDEIGPETAGAEADDLIAMRMAFLAGDAQLEAAEIEARATAPMIEPGAEVDVEVAVGSEVEPEAVVEPEVEAVVTPEVEAEAVVEPQATAESPSASPTTEVPDWELSEREAEAEALREAVALLLEGEADAGADAGSTPESAEAAKSAEAANPAEPVSQDSRPEPHRRGFLRRIMGG